MPAAPQTWLAEFIAKLSAPGVSTQPDIIQLADGDILVSWTSTVSGEIDIMAQRFNPLGQKVGGEFRLNGFSADSESAGDMAATADGGFITVYRGLADGVVSLRLTQFQADGSQDSRTIVADSDAAGPNVNNPAIAVGTDGAMIVYEQINGSARSLVAKTYDPSTGAFSSQFTVLSSASGVGAPTIAALNNGDFVIAGVIGSGAESGLVYRILNADGGGVTAGKFVTGSNNDGFAQSDVQVAALAGGGFVLTYTETDASDTDVMYRVYDAEGVQLAVGSAGSTGGSLTNNNNDADVVGLSDGSFIIALDNDTANVLEVTRVAADGSPLGHYTFAGAGSSAPTAVAFEDGRFGITWRSNAGEIRVEILDARDEANDLPAYTDGWEIGTVGDDVITAAFESEQVHGWDGDDVITASGMVKTYYGGDGDDRINVVSAVNEDAYHGGLGFDLIDWSGNAADLDGVTFDLMAGTAKAGAATEEMSSFIDLIGTAFDDVILGSDGTNTLWGGAGDDVIDGRLSYDEMHGGLGDDVFKVRDVGDKVFEAAGEGYDTVMSTVTFNAAGQSIEKIVLVGTTNINAAGNELDNLMIGGSGRNRLDGKAGADTMQGGLGDDVYVVDTAGDKVIESVGEGTDTVLSTITYTLNAALENLTLIGSAQINAVGNALDNVIIGNDRPNVIVGQGGRDRMTGGAGADRFDFNAVSDSATNAYDRITDLTNDDFIDLASIDANSLVAGNQVFSLVNAFTGQAGQITLTWNAQAGFTVLAADVNGDKVADMRIVLDGNHTGFDNFIF